MRSDKPDPPDGVRITWIRRVKPCGRPMACECHDGQHEYWYAHWLDEQHRQHTKYYGRKRPPGATLASEVGRKPLARKPVQERFDAYVDKSGECWQWLGSTSAKSGYGYFYAGKLRLAHRVSYELHVGPISDGLDLDHLCRNRGCVNPAHLEPVTRKVNINRGISARKLQVLERK